MPEIKEERKVSYPHNSLFNLFLSFNLETSAGGATDQHFSVTNNKTGTRIQSKHNRGTVTQVAFIHQKEKFRLKRYKKGLVSTVLHPVWSEINGKKAKSLNHPAEELLLSLIESLRVFVYNKDCL